MLCYQANWLMGYAFSSFEITFVPQMRVKGQFIANFLMAHACLDNKELLDGLPDDEVMLVERKSW